MSLFQRGQDTDDPEHTARDIHHQRSRAKGAARRAGYRLALSELPLGEWTHRLDRETIAIRRLELLDGMPEVWI